MSGTPVSQSRIDRVLGTFARFGLDLRPLAQHLRAAIIRPARHDVAQLSAKNDELTAQLATQRLVTGEEIAELRRDLALASARNDERARSEEHTSQLQSH